VKIHIEVEGGLPEDEVVIRCGRVDDTIQKIHQYILEQTGSPARITFYKDNEEFYFPLEKVLFFETEGERNFARASKSAIVNTRNIYSVTRNLTASSLIRFAGSHKQVYVSRYYYSALRERLNPGGDRLSRADT
jgi:DNA-binding LytR/AlgR family response regulator